MVGDQPLGFTSRPMHERLQIYEFLCLVITLCATLALVNGQTHLLAETAVLDEVYY